MEDKLLTREEFKKQIFGKTNGKCCVPGCDLDAVDAHHIIDRKLWTDGVIIFLTTLLFTVNIILMLNED